jgi:hypothetical protein
MKLCNFYSGVIEKSGLWGYDATRAELLVAF